MDQRRARSCPQTKGPIDVQPSAVAMHDVCDLIEWVERAGVDLAGLGYYDERPMTRRQRARQRNNLHASGIICGDTNDTVVTESKIT
jgi:hypothetical protein